MITAKVKLLSKVNYVDSDVTGLTFCPDYADGANSEWARNTPTLNLSMSVIGSVGALFETHKTYTLQFAENED